MPQVPDEALQYAQQRIRALEQEVAELHARHATVSQTRQEDASDCEFSHQRQLAELNSVLSCMPEPYLILNREGVVIRANSAAEDLYGTNPMGKSRDELARMVDLSLPGGLPIPHDALPSSRALRGETVRNAPLQFNDVRGRVLCILSSAAPLVIDDRIEGAVVGWRDITPQEELTKQAQRHAAELDAIISSMADGLMILTPEWRISRMNTAARNILGYTDVPDEALPRYVASLRAETPDGQRYMPEEMPAYRALHGERVLNQVMMLHTSPTRAIWVATSAGPLYAPDGTHLGAVITFTDITTLHTLQQQQKDFIHIVSHDLRSPLTTIHGHTQLIEQSLRIAGINGQLRESTDTIRRSVWRMNAMIQDLADAARLEGKQLLLNRQSTDLPTFLHEILHRAHLVLDTARIQVNVHGTPPRVFADPDRLERIFTNLLSNALKYSPKERPVFVTIEGAEHEVHVAVTDLGEGINAEDMSHLFERFYRGKGIRKPEGIGLGLYITRMLVEAHQGQIWVESVLGEGSTFHFTLPIAHD